MTPLPSPQTSGKQPGKQIRKGLGFWGSKRTHGMHTCGSGVARSLEAASYGWFGALPMPKAAERPLRHASCCFPHASPVSQTKAGKQKTAPTDRSKPMISLMKFGADEGIRTLDPNLGKVRNRLDPHHCNFLGLPARRNCGASRFHPLHGNVGSFTDTAGLHNLSSFHELLWPLCRPPQRARCRGGGHND
jgi:hypothetical protein